MPAGFEKVQPVRPDIDQAAGRRKTLTVAARAKRLVEPTCNAANHGDSAHPTHNVKQCGDSSRPFFLRLDDWNLQLAMQIFCHTVGKVDAFAYRTTGEIVSSEVQIWKRT
jgi:hypothetical protein